jgi:adenine-specific DNA-methyltransferase
MRKIFERFDDNITVLDFFVGSGTTGDAILELNKDGGSRQLILCTNNENNICEEITYKRIRCIIEGYTNLKGKKVKGLGGTLKYFKTGFIKKQNNDTVTDEDKIKLTYEVGTVLALKENTFDEVKKSTHYQIFSSSKQLTAIYFSENKIDLSELIEHLINQEKPCKLYLFSWTKGEYKHEFSEYENITAEDIPEPILDVYKSIGVI